jgi:hypothetical protein
MESARSSTNSIAESMTYPYPAELGDSPEHVVRQEVREMDDRTLDIALNGIGGPKFDPHQRRLLQDELAERRRQDMIAAELADEASGYGDPASVLDDTPLDRFDQQELAVGLDQLDEFEAGSSTPGASPVAKPLDDYSGRRSEPRPSPGPEVPPEAIRKLRLVVGALLLEALLIKRTKDTIQSRFNRAESFVLGDDSIPVQLTDHLWSVCSAADRGDIVETILEGSQRDAMDEILALCKETGISID